MYYIIQGVTYSTWKKRKIRFPTYSNCDIKLKNKNYITYLLTLFICLFKWNSIHSRIYSNNWKLKVLLRQSRNSWYIWGQICLSQDKFHAFKEHCWYTGQGCSKLGVQLHFRKFALDRGWTTYGNSSSRCCKVDRWWILELCWILVNWNSSENSSILWSIRQIFFTLLWSNNIDAKRIIATEFTGLQFIVTRYFSIICSLIDWHETIYITYNIL